MVETLLDKHAKWLDASGPQPEHVIMTQGSLVRNLADFPFPGRCSREDLRAVEERALNAIESAGLLEKGQYYSFIDADSRDIRFFQERQLVTENLIRATGPRGVYVSHDQSISVMVNELNHIRIRQMMSGLEPSAAWTGLNALDDALSQTLDFAFDERLGYLSPKLTEVGTGFTLAVTLHLPALTSLSRILGIEQRVREQHHVLQGLFGAISEAPGALYKLSNQATLGRAEQEIVYHIRHFAQDILEQENEARNTLCEEGLLSLEDRVNRALGNARGARLLELREALEVLSSLRLGLTAGVVSNLTYRLLNELTIEAHPAHLELRHGAECDDLTLSTERASLFRARIS